MLTKILKAIFGSKSSRDIKRLMPKVRRINEIEAEYQKLTEEQLKAKTAEFQERIRNGATTDDIMCEAFAAVKTPAAGSAAPRSKSAAIRWSGI